MAFFEESNPCDVDIDELITALTPQFGMIRTEDLRFYYHGTYNVFEFKDLILRVPDVTLRNAKGVELIQQEVLKLKNLQNFLTVPIPVPHIISLDESLPYMTYKKLKGTPLSKAYSSLTSPQKKNTAIQLTQFLNELHSPALLHQVNARIFNTRFSPKELHAYWEKRYESIQESTYAVLSLDQQRWNAAVFERYLNNTKNFQIQLGITHCDFDFTNILVNPQTGDLMGIVDFEDTGAWDPVADLLFYEEPIFHQKILERYQYKTETMFDRMQFFYSRTWSEYADFGLRNDKPSMVKYGLIRLEQIRRQFPHV
jgi:aminoglycoside phosphotransferase (APT) family kinase protein